MSEPTVEKWEAWWTASKRLDAVPPTLTEHQLAGAEQILEALVEFAHAEVNLLNDSASLSFAQMQEANMFLRHMQETLLRVREYLG